MPAGQLGGARSGRHAAPARPADHDLGPTRALDPHVHERHAAPDTEASPCLTRPSLERRRLEVPGLTLAALEEGPVGHRRIVLAPALVEAEAGVQAAAGDLGAGAHADRRDDHARADDLLPLRRPRLVRLGVRVVRLARVADLADACLALDEEGLARHVDRALHAEAGADQVGIDLGAAAEGHILRRLVLGVHVRHLEVAQVAPAVDPEDGGLLAPPQRELVEGVALDTGDGSEISVSVTPPAIFAGVLQPSRLFVSKRIRLR